jgi:TRAP-type mannitol/chloroaromatic compound transport system substrate-binding protein
MSRRSSGISRGQFLRTAGIGAAGVGAAMMGSGVASAVKPPSPPVSVNMYQNLSYQGGSPYPGLNDPAMYDDFIALLKIAGIDVIYQEPVGGIPTVNTNGASDGTYSGINDIHMVAGAGSQLSTGWWHQLFWHNPFMGFTAESMIGYLYHGRGNELRQELIDTEFGPGTPNGGDGVIVLPISVSPGEGGGWSSHKIESLSDPHMRISGSMIKHILEGAGIRVFAATPGQNTGLNLFTDPDPINMFEFNIASSDIDHRQVFPLVAGEGYKLATPNLATYCKNYYKGCWWSTAIVFDIKINKAFWDSLHEDQRMAIRNASRISCINNLVKNRANIEAAYASICALGVTLHDAWPQNIQSRLRESTDDVFDARSASDPKFKEVLEHMEDYLDACGGN